MLPRKPIKKWCYPGEPHGVTQGHRNFTIYARRNRVIPRKPGASRGSMAAALSAALSTVSPVEVAPVPAVADPAEPAPAPSVTVITDANPANQKPVLSLKNRKAMP